MSSKWKRKGNRKFIQKESYLFLSAAYRALNPVERSAYDEIKWRYDGTNNGAIGLGERELAGAINMSKDTARRALSGLQDKGFIVKVRKSGFSVKNRTATEWRLTEYECHRTGQPPTKEFMRWQPPEKSTGAPMRHTGAPMRHATPVLIAKTG